MVSSVNKIGRKNAKFEGMLGWEAGFQVCREIFVAFFAVDRLGG
jgi:hypothetical protein